VHETSPEQRPDLAEPVAAIRLAATIGLLARIVGTIPPDPGSGSRTAAVGALNLRTQIYVLKFAVVAICRRWRAF
jgi:hypothetical protein